MLGSVDGQPDHFILDYEDLLMLLSIRVEFSWGGLFITAHADAFVYCYYLWARVL